MNHLCGVWVGEGGGAQAMHTTLPMSQCILVGTATPDPATIAEWPMEPLPRSLILYVKMALGL